MADDTRDRVLKAAGPIFARKGFEAATIREICAAAEVNVASVNYHFGDKQTLYIETIRLAHTLRLQELAPESWPAGTSPESKLRTFVGNLLARIIGADQIAWYTQIMLREMLEPTAACRPIVEDFIRPQHNRLLEIIAELAPETDSQLREKIAFSVIGQCLHYRVAGEFVSILIAAPEREKHFQIEQLAEHIADFTLAALSMYRNGVQPSAATAHGHSASID